MKKIALLCTLLPTVLLHSCRSDKARLTKIWFYTYHVGDADTQDTLLTPASFLDLENDGTYTLDFHGFDTGKWDVSGDQLLLTDNRNQLTKISLRYVSEKELRIYLHDAVFEFAGYPNHPMTKAENPFSIINNRWRIHPAAKETDQQITNRLANHFAFWIAYFEWALDNDINYVDVRSTPTLIKIYGNGFGLKPFEQLPATWKSCFYDDDDCRKANDRVERLFDDNSIALPHTDNRFKLYISGFQQLKQKI